MPDPAPPPSRLERRLPAAVFIGVPLLLTLWALRDGGFLKGLDVVTVFYGLHGAVGDATMIEELRGYLTAVRDRVAELDADGRAPEEIEATIDEEMRYELTPPEALPAG